MNVVVASQPLFDPLPPSPLPVTGSNSARVAIEKRAESSSRVPASNLQLRVKIRSWPVARDPSVAERDRSCLLTQLTRS